ncbi:MAG: GNAT family N-acetyltransferase [Ignavibacteriales bacterium]|nr:GNAT family N-acetyltransferase [Ignavibacteriales bacterium]
MNNQSNSSLTELNDKLLAGKAALEQSEIDDLIINLRIELSRAVKGNQLANEPDAEQWQNIFDGLFSSELAAPFMENMDKDLFFGFGEYLGSFTDQPNNRIVSIIHNYLNLFRTSSFLQKIYDERRWDKLIHTLIVKSYYTFDVLFNQRVNQYKKKSLFRIIKDSNTIDYSWQKTSDIVSLYRSSISHILFEIESQNKIVAFLLENSLEMVMLDLACLTSGIVNAMIPANSVSEHISYILNQTKAPILFADDEKQLAKIRSIKKETPFLKTVVMLKGNAAEDWVISFEEFKAMASDHSIKTDVLIKPDSLATLMYTSGTTGEPKGIMFSHTNIVYKRFCRAMAIPGISDADRYLAFLPLYHTFGRWLEMTGAIFWGAEYCFMENPSVETMIDNMRLVKPSIFISIPKKWIQLYEYITTRIDVEVDDDEKIKEAVVNATGGNLKWGLSAAGFLPPDIFRFLQRYGVELMSGFGMTEATGGITMTPPFQYRENSLGKALPGIEIRLGDDGEILIRGPYVMQNYYDQKFEETFDAEGWLATGDVMRMDKDGFIEIIDRKKEIYKNVKGETIAPQKIENLFRDFEFVKQVFLAGDHRPFNTVLIFPDLESEHSPLKNMDEQQRQEYFSTVIVSVNNFLAPFERILDFRIITRAFDDANGELTPKGTYKRRVIEKNFEEIIQSMYQKDHLSLPLGKYEVKIPNWFLREKGALSRDVFLRDNAILIPKLNSTLLIKNINEAENIFQIGNFSYRINTKQIDLQDILTNPFYWLGNVELVEFAGQGIFRWYRKTEAERDIEFVERIIPVKNDEVIRNNFAETLFAKEISILGLHFGMVMLQSDLIEDNNKAIEYFSEILRDIKSTHYKLAVEIAFRPKLINELSIQRKMFLAAFQSLRKDNFRKLLELYTGIDHKFLNKEIILSIENISRGDENLKEIETVIENFVVSITSKSHLSKTSIPNLFQLLVSYGVNHPSSYERIRRFFLQYELYGSTKDLRAIALKSRMEIRNQFTAWLGQNQRVAIDPETGEEYRWDDVLIFDQAISEDDQSILRRAISERQIIREAIFLFSGHVLISLNNILPSGVWISKYSETEKRSVFRVTVQTRFQGGFDLAIHLNHKEASEMIEEEIKWKVIAGTEVNGEKLAAKLGGLWEDYNLWTEEFVGDESVERFIRREYKRNDELTLEKLRNLWKFFVWSAAAAYVKFWKLSDMKMELTDTTPDGLIVSPHDYQTGCIITSFSKRRKTESTLAFVMNFYESFVKQTEEKYPQIKKASVWNAIFSGIIEAEGIDNGISLINKFRRELGISDVDKKEDISTRIDSFIRNVKNHGYLPKQLYFAVKRFHRWYSLNRSASLSAQAEMIYELYETYRLFDLEEQYPAARTRFFLETVFYNSTQRFKDVLRELVRKQRHRKISKDESLKLINALHFEFELDEKETYFITRLGYPHLKPSDTAALLSIKSEIAVQPNLVVQLQDDDGNIFTIRNPINPKEISKLHQLYLEANLNVNFRPEHHFLVAISDRGFIIGGAFYYRSDEDTVHMEKIVVSNRYRRKGISEGLMNELFSRIKSENIKFVTTGFFRPEYFYRFGFKIERKYSGLVKEL